jgi:Fibronectin type III domain
MALSVRSLPSILLVFLLLLVAFAAGAKGAESVTLAWDSNPEPDIAGYRLYSGKTSHSYRQYVDTSTTQATVSNLVEGTTYFFAVTAFDTAGLESAFSNEISYSVPGEILSFLGNVSSRTLVQTGDFAMIGGFILLADSPKEVVLRAIGPSLSNAGVSQVLADPTLDLLDSSGTVVASNDDWRTGGLDLVALGLAPTDDRESALIATLPGGAYSAIVRGKDDAVGVALVELYDLDMNNGRIANISTRARVETGEDVLIGGFILTGTDPAQVIVRAIGPSLASAGVMDPLLDPVLELHDADGSLIFTNDNWRSDQESQIIDTTLPPADDREAAIVVTLPPGAYSAIVRGVNDSAGVALFEVYALNQ